MFRFTPHCAALPAALLLLGLGVSARAQYTTIDDPLGIDGTWATGISGGNIVGYYYNSSFEQHGFVYNGTTYTTIDDPLGIDGIWASGISGSNIVGNYQDSSGSIHGFLYDMPASSTVPEPGSVALVTGMAVAGLGFFTRRRRK